MNSFSRFITTIEISENVLVKSQKKKKKKIAEKKLKKNVVKELGKRKKTVERNWKNLKYIIMQIWNFPYIFVFIQKQ